VADKNEMRNFDETRLGKDHLKDRGDVTITHE